MGDTPTFRPFPANDKLLSVRSTLGSCSKEKLSRMAWAGYFVMLQLATIIQHLELKLTNLMHCLKLGLIPRKKVKDDVYIFSFSNLFKNSLVIRSVNGLSN